MEWESGAKRIFDAFAGHPDEENEDFCMYMHKGLIPVYVYIYDDSEYIKSLDTVVYEHEHFKIPNPYSKFIELHG